MNRKLPTGIQSFEKLRQDNFLYIDKTEYIYNLVKNNVPYFLSRPRRFGKSLLLSALKAYWEGKRELFKGLKIEDLENSDDGWKKYPVFYFDFNGESYENVSIEVVLDQILSRWEEEYGRDPAEQTLGLRFERLLEKAYLKTGLRAVVLVDEYDKPLLEMIDDKERLEHTKNVYKGFFSRLKKADEFIHFIFITGVSKFHKVSIFSDLNQLRDISMDSDFNSVCGITEYEIMDQLLPYVDSLAQSQGMTRESCLEMLKQTYDGYRFHPEGDGVFNPYSLFGAFAAKDFVLQYPGYNSKIRIRSIPSDEITEQTKG